MSNTAPIFLGGAGRSGTTLLRVILDSHSHIACGPELKATPLICQLWYKLQTGLAPTLQAYHLTTEDVNQTFAQLLLSLLEKYCRQAGKARIAEKSPYNVLFFEHLHYLFPDSPLVQVIRDGRDVVCSLLTMDWRDPFTGQQLDCTASARGAAAHWVECVRAGRLACQKPTLRQRYGEVRYEDVVQRPEPTLQALFAFLGEPWDAAVLRYHERERDLASESSAAQVRQALYASSVGRWRRDLAPADRAAVKEVAGDLLIELGYAGDRDW